MCAQGQDRGWVVPAAATHVVGAADVQQRHEAEGSVAAADLGLVVLQFDSSEPVRTTLVSK